MNITFANPSALLVFINAADAMIEQRTESGLPVAALYELHHQLTKPLTVTVTKVTDIEDDAAKEVLEQCLDLSSGGTRGVDFDLIFEGDVVIAE